MCIIKVKGVIWRKEKKRVKVDLVLFIDRLLFRKKKYWLLYKIFFMLCYVRSIIFY